MVVSRNLATAHLEFSPLSRVLKYLYASLFCSPMLIGNDIDMESPSYLSEIQKDRQTERGSVRERWTQTYQGDSDKEADI